MGSANAGCGPDPWLQSLFEDRMSRIVSQVCLFRREMFWLLQPLKVKTLKNLELKLAGGMSSVSSDFCTKYPWFLVTSRCHAEGVSPLIAGNSLAFWLVAISFALGHSFCTWPVHGHWALAYRSLFLIAKTGSREPFNRSCSSGSAWRWMQKNQEPSSSQLK